MSRLLYLCAFAVAGRSLERANAAACAPGEARVPRKRVDSEAHRCFRGWLLAEDRNIIINPPSSPYWSDCICTNLYSGVGMR